MIIKTKDGWKPLGKPIDFSKFVNTEYVEQPLDDEQRKTMLKDKYGNHPNDYAGIDPNEDA